MVRSSPLSLTKLGLSALCLMTVMSPSFAAKPEQLKNRAMGTKVDCRGAHSCASWLTTNFAGKRPLAILANDRWIVSIAPLGRSLPGKGPDVEDDLGNDGTEPPGTGGDTPTGDGEVVANDNNGHGNDPGHVDDSNPGNSGDNQNGGADNSGSDNSSGGGADNSGSDNSSEGGADNNGNNPQPGDNGHGNDPGHVDDSNPGNSSDNQNGGVDNNGSDNGNAGGSSNNGPSSSDTGNGGQHDDNGHGNDPGHSDSSNPGKGK